MRKVARDFKFNYVNNKYSFYDDRDAFGILNKLYKKHLKKTRLEVCEFFFVSDEILVDKKIMTRLYYYYLPQNDENRTKMDQINCDVNYIFARLSLGYKFPVFLEDEKCFTEFFSQPKDVRFRLIC